MQAASEMIMVFIKTKNKLILFISSLSFASYTLWCRKTCPCIFDNNSAWLILCKKNNLVLPNTLRFFMVAVYEVRGVNLS